MERGALVIEHDIVRPGHADQEGEPGGAQQGQQGVHIILIRFRVVGIADVAADRQAHQLAAEVIFQPSANNLLAVVEILRTDKADHRIDQQRFKVAGDGVGPRLAGLLVDAVVGVGRQAAPLAGLKIHHIVAEGTAPEAQGRLAGLLQHGKIDAEAAVGRFGSRHRLKHQIHRRAALNQLQRIGDVGQNAGLGGNGEALDNIVQHHVQLRQHR